MSPAEEQQQQQHHQQRHGEHQRLVVEAPGGLRLHVPPGVAAPSCHGERPEERGARRPRP
jgi:hypothetical protein